MKLELKIHKNHHFIGIPIFKGFLQITVTWVSRIGIMLGRKSSLKQHVCEEITQKYLNPKFLWRSLFFRDLDQCLF